MWLQRSVPRAVLTHLSFRIRLNGAAQIPVPVPFVEMLPVTKLLLRDVSPRLRMEHQCNLVPGWAPLVPLTLLAEHVPKRPAPMNDKLLPSQEFL